MQKYFNNVADNQGNAIAGASVTVTTTAGLLATIYSDNASTPQANPIPTDQNGYFAFYAADGRYNITISGARTNPSTVITDILLEDPIDNPENPQLADYAALRAYTGTLKSVYVTGYLVSISPSGIAGDFTRDDADTTSPDNGGTIIVAANGKRWKRIYSGAVNVQWFGAKGDDASDDGASIQSAINYCMKQYDPTETTHDGNNVVYRGKQKPLWFPQGIYRTSILLNISFRNDIRIFGDGEYNTFIAYIGATTTTGSLLNAKCSNYVEVSNLTLDGRFKVNCMVYCAGNGVNAPGSKGNVTGNNFHDLFCWNQIGDLVTLGDWPDQYSPKSAMICLMTSDAVDSSFNSCDDSYIQNVRFATNSVNNSYAMALSSSNLQISNCTVFAANGVLLGNGASPFFHQIAWEIYGYQAIDATHNHAVLKFASGNFGLSSGVALADCYFESGYNGPTPTTAKLAYLAPYTGGGPVDTWPRIEQILIQGGLYSAELTDINYIDIGSGNRGNIKIVNAAFQGNSRPRISAPDCSVFVEDNSSISSGSTVSYNTWQIISAKNSEREFTTPDGHVSGYTSPDITVVVGTTNYPAQLKFTSIDEALAFVNASKAKVTIALTKNDTINNSINIKAADLTIALQGFTLTIPSTVTVKNYGMLTIDGGGVSGVLAGTSRKLFNYGTLYVQSMSSVTAVVTMFAGIAFFQSTTFAGIDDNIGFSGYGKVVINHDSCTYTNTQFIANLVSNLGELILRSTTSTTPTTGNWYRGTQFERIQPAAGAVVKFWACSNGVGALATWKSNGNLV